MATTYTKNALNKIKKVDLVQLFLEQQGKMNDMVLSMEQEQYDGRWAEDVHSINMKDKEIKKLKDNLDYQKKMKRQLREENKRMKEGFKKLKELSLE